MTKYRVYAQNASGTRGEQPPFEADSPEEAAEMYNNTRPTPFPIVKIVAED